MTAAQEEALAKADALLREHFESSVIIAETLDEDGENHAFNLNYDGGLTYCIGMCARAQARLTQKALINETGQ